MAVKQKEPAPAPEYIDALAAIARKHGLSSITVPGVVEMVVGAAVKPPTGQERFEFRDPPEVAAEARDPLADPATFRGRGVPSFRRS